MRFACCVLLAGMSASCVRHEDADPKLERVEIIGIAQDARLDRFSAVELLVSGSELWRRSFQVQVHLKPETHEARIIDTMALQFDEAVEHQTASTTWMLDIGALIAGFTFRPLFDGILKR